MNLKSLGNLLIVLALILLASIYVPILFQESKYQFKTSILPRRREQVMPPVSKDFGLVIPQIGINSKVFANVDAYNPREYQPVLAKGVAHAQGSALPSDSEGYVFIFAHSAESPFNIVRYHAIFYLLNKLEKGEEINIFYQNKRYDYQVVEKKVVLAQEALDYISRRTSKNFLILQTCWPPGTTLKRLIVIARKFLDKKHSIMLYMN